MRIISGLVAVLLVGLAVNGCDLGNISNPTNQTVHDSQQTENVHRKVRNYLMNISKKDRRYYEQNIANNRPFKKLMNSLDTINRFLNRPDIHVSKDISISEINKKSDKFESEKEKIKFLSNIINKPGKYFILLQLQSKYMKQFLDQTPSFTSFNKKQQKELIKYAVLKEHTTVAKRKAFTFSVPRLKTNNIESGGGTCEEQRLDAKTDCSNIYTLALLLCGFASPNPPIAGLCAFAAYYDYRTCLDDADSDYEICKQLN